MTDVNFYEGDEPLADVKAAFDRGEKLVTAPPVMQPRCVRCLAEQYALAVWDISHGRAGCAWCGHVPPVFTDEQAYRDALKAARERHVDTA